LAAATCQEAQPSDSNMQTTYRNRGSCAGKAVFPPHKFGENLHNLPWLTAVKH
jgi:hypothetical protein